MSVLINNKKARFEFEILETYTVGLVLQGSEIKSIRNGKASIKEGYCFLEKGEMYIKNMHISPYEEASYANHDPIRDRKLLLNSQEIKKIERKLRDVGITIVPLKVFMSSKGWAKMDIALARGKKLYDKREDLKRKDEERQMSRSKNQDD